MESWALRSTCQGFTRRVRPVGGENDVIFPVGMVEATMREATSETCIPEYRYSDPCSRSW